MIQQLREQWSNSFWDCFADGVKGCLCGFFCPSCYMARARTRYDHSNCCLNCHCIGSGILRDIVREGYNIEGSCEILKCFCPPCNAIQVNAEVSKRGPRLLNQSKQDTKWTHSLLACCSDGCGSCCCACCCLSCFWAQIRTRYDRSNCFTNFCCLGSAAARNIVREGYGIEGSCVGDVCVTMCCPCCAAIQTSAETTARGDMKTAALLAKIANKPPQIVYVQQQPQQQVIYIEKPHIQQPQEIQQKEEPKQPQVTQQKEGQSVTPVSPHHDTIN